MPDLGLSSVVQISVFSPMANLNINAEGAEYAETRSGNPLD